jgi:hypothetical protein
MPKRGFRQAANGFSDDIRPTPYLTRPHHGTSETLA